MLLKMQRILGRISNPGLKSDKTIHEVSFSCNSDGLVESYKTYLLIKSQQHHQKYLKLYKNNPEAARAEAFSFIFLRESFDRVDIAEDVSDGGGRFFLQISKF